MSAPEIIEITESPNKIIGVIVHDLVKKDGEFSVDERGDLLPVSQTVQRLVDQLVSEYESSPKSAVNSLRFSQ